MLTISSNIAEFSRRVGKMPAALSVAEQKATGKCAKVVEVRVIKHFVGYSAASKGATLASQGLVRQRTGHLKQSLNSSDAKKDGAGWFATVGFRKGVVDAYAETVERGRTFTPSKQLLAIPVGEALTAAGVARYRSPRDVSDGFWRQSVSGFVGFYQWVGKRLNLLFIGRRRVEVKAFKPLQRSLDGTRGQFKGIYEAEVAVALRKALGGR